jgi:hypothetical protein
MVSPCGRASHGSCGLVLAYNKNRSARGERDNRVCAQEECNCDLVARATRGLSAHGRARPLPSQRLPASAPRVRSAPALLCDNHRSRRPKACRCNPARAAVLISPVNGCARHREVSAAHSQRYGGLVAGLVLGFAARRRRPEVRSEKMRKNVQVRIMNQQK